MRHFLLISKNRFCCWNVDNCRLGYFSYIAFSKLRYSTMISSIFVDFVNFFLISSFNIDLVDYYRLRQIYWFCRCHSCHHFRRFLTIFSIFSIFIDFVDFLSVSSIFIDFVDFYRLCRFLSISSIFADYQFSSVIDCVKSTGFLD